MKNLIFAVIFCFGASAMAIPTDPVMVGGEESLDACGGYGIATVTTTLFTTNSQGYSEFKTIDASQGVYFCDYKKDYDGEYYGVVFSRDEKTDCGVSSPIATKQPYNGKCESGWVKKEFLLLIAG